jgi:uncharacterized protein (TIGR02611 family)
MAERPGPTEDQLVRVPILGARTVEARAIGTPGVAIGTRDAGEGRDNLGVDIRTSRGRIDRALDRLRSTRAGRLAVKITVIALGAAVIIVGIILLPLPGPGWLIIFAGIAIWSIEFGWAARLQVFARRTVFRWTSWYAQQGWPLRILVGLVTLALVAGIVVVSWRISFGPGIFDRILSLIAAGTGKVDACPNHSTPYR